MELVEVVASKSHTFSHNCPPTLSNPPTPLDTHALTPTPTPTPTPDPDPFPTTRMLETLPPPNSSKPDLLPMPLPLSLSMPLPCPNAGYSSSNTNSVRPSAAASGFDGLGFETFATLMDGNFDRHDLLLVLVIVEAQMGDIGV